MTPPNDALDAQPDDAQPLELLMTEDALFAEMGRLYFKNHLLHERVRRLEMEALARSVKLPPEEEDGHAVGES